MSSLSKKSAIYWGAFILCIGYYFGVGAFPISHFKGDGTSMAIGSLQIMQHGWDGPRIDYGRETRPGVFFALIGLQSLTGANPYLLFSLLTLAGGVACVVFTALFAARLIHIPAPLCGIAVLLLFPDSSTWGCYPNGTALAGGLGMIALYLLARTERPRATTLLLAGVLAGFAVLARVNAILLGLVSVPLLWTSDRREMLKRLAILAVPAILIALGGIYASGATITGLLNTTQSVLAYQDKQVTKSFIMKLATSEAFTACIAFFPLLTAFLIVLGVIRLFQKRQWNLLCIVAAGLLPILAVYYNHIYGSPLYYTIPLFALLCLSTSEWLPAMSRGTRLWMGGIAALLFVVQYPIGVNIALRAKPYFPCQSLHWFPWEKKTSRKALSAKSWWELGWAAQ